jgi:Arc/MetJ-type ribon-helix-helix transcriptional regulator
VRTRIFGRLREIARSESTRNGDYTSVSDIVRAALSDWIRVYESTTVLYELQYGVDKRRTPVG